MALNPILNNLVEQSAANALREHLHHLATIRDCIIEIKADLVRANESKAFLLDRLPEIGYEAGFEICNPNADPDIISLEFEIVKQAELHRFNLNRQTELLRYYLTQV
ncbi:hypothetical protein [Oceaniovalibus sp. ACAM 378]|uniref:hypothetical protein n=1 Tax=Oceaniovalibus sp. ACAM 378 TaxID=2599923 RepID=UPI0011D8101F|nr:hypothetical protein [Oceaniovalibus sp. ACAM 378]TYB85534.1 hypothetical protein FQ320_18625 [Oceaniovalibus sp. ACAM 378]